MAKFNGKTGPFHSLVYFSMSSLMFNICIANICYQIFDNHLGTPFGVTDDSSSTKNVQLQRRHFTTHLAALLKCGELQ